MKQNSFQKKTLGNLAEKVQPYSLKIEVAMTVCVALGFALRSIAPFAYGALVSVSLLVLAHLYYLFAFRQEKSATTVLQQILFRMIGLGQALTVVGMLILVNNWPGGSVILIVGALSLGVANVILVFMRNTNKINKESTQVDIIRSSVILLAALGANYLIKVGLM